MHQNGQTISPLAVAHHTGDLLPNLYDDWALLPRLQRQEQYLTLLERLAEHCQTQADLPRALAYARQVTQADPLREEAHQQLLRRLGRAGRLNEALAHYEHLRRLLAEAVAQKAAPTDDDLAAMLGVSRRTVLRDMELLAVEGVALPTRKRNK